MIGMLKKSVARVALRFIHAKNDQTSLTNFNISVTVTDRFMQAVERGDKWYLWDRSGERNGPLDTLDARRLWREIATAARLAGACCTCASQ